MTAPTVVSPRRTGHPGYSQTMPSVTATASAARRLARAALATWRLDDTADAAELVLCELVANAVRHGRSDTIRVIIDRPADDRVYLAVVDKSPWRPPVLQAEPLADAIGGRGLVLVEQLAERWGYDMLGWSRPWGKRAPWGKRVWAELTTQTEMTEADT